MPFSFLPILEDAGNRVLRLDPETLKRLGDLQGRVVCLEFRDLQRKLYLHPSESGFRLTAGHDRPAAVTLRATLTVFARLGLESGNQGPAIGELEIEGDVALGQRFQQLFRSLQPDWEEPLARVFGDPLGHEIGRTLRAAFAWQRQALATFGMNAAEYLQEEKRLLPVRYEVEEFLAAVDTLRSDVDRAAARVARLKERLRA